MPPQNSSEYPGGCSGRTPLKFACFDLIQRHNERSGHRLTRRRLARLFILARAASMERGNPRQACFIVRGCFRRCSAGRLKLSSFGFARRETLGRQTIASRPVERLASLYLHLCCALACFGRGLGCGVGRPEAAFQPVAGRVPRPRRVC